MGQVVIYQQNMCGYNKDKDTKNIGLHIREKNALIGLLEVWINKKPDVVFLSEVSKNLFDEINTIEGYSLIQPPGRIAKSDTAVCLIAIKNEYYFERKTRQSIIVNKRYIEVTLGIDEFQIECFFAYVPQAYDNTAESINRRRNMIEGICDFLKENHDKPLLIAGDLNTDINDINAKCKKEFYEILNYTMDTVTDKDKGKPTWNGKCLDYALVSNALNKKYMCVTEYIPDTGSDHKGLLTTITEKEV